MKIFGRNRVKDKYSYNRSINTSCSRTPVRPDVPSVTELLTSTDYLCIFFQNKNHSSENCNVLNVTERKELCKRHGLVTGHLLIVDNEGRYEVQLPWGADHIILNSNENICKELLKSTTKKLLQKNKFDDYESVFNQWIDDGVTEDVPFNEIEEKSHYLTHRGVFKELSATKVPPVLDASCRVQNSFIILK
ncbi:uncharacterized protein NPIL_46421 [Nephila pilipes]|uniref:Uncharacterized protein n=1 Tax=Nephila pilipes TaxID=299642 RepID=A0A8X6MQE5_NEPPI|nr:uncharacterized protein NPIL_46421 [Nephila pilipes]